MNAPPDPDALSGRIAGLSPAKRALLERMVAAGPPAARPKRPQRSVTAGTSRPLSFAQQRLWILDQLEPGDAAYSRPAGFRLRGPMDRRALEQSLSEVVRRHEVLRATFPDVDGEPVQRIAAPVPIPLPLVDVRELPDGGGEHRVRSLAVEEAERPFDLAAGPLVRASLYRLGDEDHVLLVVFHHIVFDAWSSEILWRELAMLYPAYVTGEPSPLTDPPIQYGDFATFERGRLEDGDLDEGLAYWRRRLEPPAPDLRLPVDRPESVVTSRGASCETLLPAPLVDSLRIPARQQNATLFMVLLAAWQTLLHRVSGEVDVAVGTPVAGRSALDTEGLIGCFVNTLVMRTDLSADPPFRVLVDRVRDEALGAYAHEDVPFDRVVAAVTPPRDTGRGPLFRAFLNLHSVPRTRPQPAGLTMEPFNVVTRTAKFDLSLELTEVPQGLASTMSFACDLFDAATIERLAQSWQVLLEAIAADPQRRLSELPAPGLEAAEQIVEPTAAAAPATITPEKPCGPIEVALAAMFCTVLGCEPVGRHDGFFDLGGHSLSAIKLVARIRRAFAVELPPRAVFDAPTPALLAVCIETAPRTRQRIQTRPTTSEESQSEAPAALGQERLWLAEQIETRSAQYHIPSARRLLGTVETTALERALGALVARHEALRTTINAGADGPVQVVGESRSVTLVEHDLRALPADRREADARRILAEEIRRPFDLSRDLMIRATSVRLGEHDHMLCLTTHHIASDGWSVDVLWRELLALYEGFVDGVPRPLPPLPVRYTDWARYERECLDRGALTAALETWRRRLDGLPPLELPTDRPRPPVQSHRGATEPFSLPPAVSKALVDLGRREGATFFMSLLAAWTALLHRLSGQSDFATGSVIAGRAHSETEGLVGLFANTLVLRTDLDGDPSFRELVARVRATVLDAYAAPDVPFQRLVEELRLHRDLGRSPLFQTMVVAQVAKRGVLEVRDLLATPIDIDPGTAKFDLTLFASDGPSGVTGRLEYATDLFDAATACRLIGRLEALIQGATSDPERPISELPMLAESERHQILVEWNDTRADYPARTIHDSFSAQAARAPDAVALIQGDRQCRFGELDAQANRLAHHIRAKNLPAASPIAIFLDRSIQSMTAFLAVLKAGSPFLAVDPGYPTERIAYLLDDSAAPLVLTEERLASRLPPTTAEIVLIDAMATELAGHRADDPHSGAGPDDAAYLVYTSGSTGKPKGVVGLHRGTVNRLTWMNRAYPFATGDVACQKTALGFVDSIAEMFGPLLGGVSSIIVPDDVVTDPWALARILSERRVTRIVLVPSLLRALLELQEELRERLPRLTLWMTSGEVLTVDVARRFATLMPHARLVNLYGSSEVAADATSYEVPATIGGLATIPIGRPIANTVVHVLDRHRAPVPIGVAGEIYVGGDGLARGYLGQPGLTDGCFVANPFGDPTVPQLYRTGDLGRYRPDGDIEFLGRADHQVKIRGVRIDPAEVEAALEAHPLVRAAAAIAVPGVSGDSQLVGYLVPAAGGPPSPSDLRDHLSRTLVPQMLPTMFVPIEDLPLTPSGKLDRGALPSPHGAAHSVAESDENPRSATEATLARMWADVLGLTRVGVNDDFFDIGGHSMLAVRLFTTIHETFGTDLPVSALFESPTIARLARVLDEGPAPNSDPTLLPLQPMGERPPLFLVPGIGNEAVAFLRLARRLAPDRPVFGLIEDLEHGARAVDKLADEFAEKIRRFRLSGPYHLGGHSSGAAVAVEVARRLRAEGAAVGVVAILDHANPGSRYGSTLPWRPRQMVRFVTNVTRWMREPGRLGVRYLVRGIPRKARYFVKVLALRLGPLGVPRPRFELSDFIDAAVYPDRWREQMSTALAARLGFSPSPYAGPITLFRARIQPLVCSFDRGLGWSDVATGGLEIHEVSGNHNSMLRETNVHVLADRLRDCLDRADEAVSRVT